MDIYPFVLVKYGQNPREAGKGGIYHGKKLLAFTMCAALAAGSLYGCAPGGQGGQRPPSTGTRPRSGQGRGKAPWRPHAQAG